MTSHSQVCSDRLIILHFILESLDPIGSLAHLLYQYIQSFIDNDNDTYEEVVFNFGDIKQHVAHQVTMEQLLHRLSVNPARRVIILMEAVQVELSCTHGKSQTAIVITCTSRASTGLC